MTRTILSDNGPIEPAVPPTDGVDPAAYGERWVEIYDAYPAHPTAEDAEPAADVLADLAGDYAALEFGIGTGRVAIPLSARGVDVRGIDASSAMLQRLREKPGGGTIPVLRGDIRRDRMDGRYLLVYAVFNTLVMLLNQADQVSCFENAAKHLEPGGWFVVETFVPDFHKLTMRKSIDVKHLDRTGAWLLSMHHDPLRQLIFNESIRIDATGVQRYPVTLRYAWPSELDLMARFAHLHLVDRFASWLREPYEHTSRNQISIYRLGSP